MCNNIVGIMVWGTDYIVSHRDVTFVRCKQDLFNFYFEPLIPFKYGSNKEYIKFTNKIMWINIHLVPGGGSQTHYLSNMSHLS